MTDNIQKLHEAMNLHIQLSERARLVRDPRMAAHWYELYLRDWDMLERDEGMKLIVGIPATPHFPSDVSIQWGQHNGFDNQRTSSGSPKCEVRGPTIFIPRRVDGLGN